MRSGGWLAAQILGHRDGWADAGGAAFRPEALPGLLAGLKVERLAETEDDRGSFDGPEHWHYYEVIARRPG